MLISNMFHLCAKSGNLLSHSHTKFAFQQKKKQALWLTLFVSTRCHCFTLAPTLDEMEMEIDRKVLSLSFCSLVQGTI